MDSCKRHALHTHTHTCSHAISNTCKVMCRVHKRNKQEIRRGARVNIRTHIEHSKQQRTELFDPNMNKTGKVVRKWWSHNTQKYNKKVYKNWYTRIPWNRDKARRGLRALKVRIVLKALIRPMFIQFATMFTTETLLRKEQQKSRRAHSSINQSSEDTNKKEKYREEARVRCTSLAAEKVGEI